MLKPPKNNIIILQALEDLDKHDVISVIGFSRCGKSTIAENLDNILKKDGKYCLLQSADNWCNFTSNRKSHMSSSGSISEEIRLAIKKFEESNGYWIIDNSEALLAHATKNDLDFIKKSLKRKRIKLVIIRNRFVFEHSGWFHFKESMIDSNIKKIKIYPLNKNLMIEVAKGLFHDDDKQLQSEWLVEWSGGVPGLMFDLHKFTPKWPDIRQISVKLEDFAIKVKESLDLNSAIKKGVITAIKCNVLPPTKLLSYDAKIELGYLATLGIISPHQDDSNRKFQGRFWDFVADKVTIKRINTSNRIIEKSLNFEIIINKSGLFLPLCYDLGIEPIEGNLAQSFANYFVCEENIKNIIISIKQYFSESLGRIGLRHLLKSAGIKIGQFSNSDELIGQLLYSLASKNG